jgi:hypothetical protein
MAIGDDAPLLESDDTARTDDGDGGRALDLARLTDRGLDLKNEGVCFGDLNLRRLSFGSQNANVFNGTKRRTDDGQGFLASKLPRLAEILHVSE